MKILVINPGSTSTKLSIYEDVKELVTKSYFHDAPELMKYSHVNKQVPFRKEYIFKFLKEINIDIKEIDVISARGGSAYSQISGVIEIDERLYLDTLNGTGGSEHPAKLGVLLGYELSKKYNIPSFTMDATNVDELIDVARITGIKGLYRNAQAHVLNQKAVSKYYASITGKKYEDLNLIVCHIDGGITVGAHQKGKLIDCNVGSGGDGSFTPTRIGSIPVLALLDYIEKHSIKEVRDMCSRSGGFVSFFETSNVEIIREKIKNHDVNAKLIWDAMIYNIAKEIGAMASVLKGQVDQIILTGGFIRFADLIEDLKSYIDYVSDVTCVSDKEQDTLALEVYRVMKKEINAHKYTGEPVFKGFKGIDY